MRFLYCGADKYPDTKQISEDFYVLQKPFVSTMIDSGTQILVPAGLITDYGSIPDFAQSFFDKAGANSGSYLTHDFLYSIQIYRRSVSDWNLLLSLKLDGMNWFKRNSAWLAVKAVGGKVWDNNSEESIEDVKKITHENLVQIMQKKNQFGLYYKRGSYFKGPSYG